MICLQYRTPAQNLMGMAIKNPKLIKAITEELNWNIKEDGWSFHVVYDGTTCYWELTSSPPTKKSHGLYFYLLNASEPLGTYAFKKTAIFEASNNNKTYCYA